VTDGTETVAVGETPASFKGDAAVSNGRITLVVPKNGGTAEIRSGGVARAKLSLVGVEKFDRVALVEHGKGGATLEVASKGASVRLKVKKGDVTVEAQPGETAGKLRVECPSRFIVLPDFFADDIVIDARKLPSATAEIPSENFLLQLAGGGDAIVMSVFENKEQDVRLLTGTDDLVAAASET
jgi:hypothetical protein